MRRRERKKERKKVSEIEKKKRERPQIERIHITRTAYIFARNMRYADRKLIIFLMQHIMFYTYILYILYI